MPLDQARRDRAAGLKTAVTIVVGVPGLAAWGSMTRRCGPLQKLLDTHDIRFVPGLNEELAVSALRGTQELQWFGKSAFEGVFGLWYGKGVGVDRACESLKLGNLEGAAAKGGFLAVAGDDHGGKSSDSAHQSEQTLIAAFLPILYPATIGEIIEFGLFGWAMSRYSGSYVALKCITDTLDLSGCVDLTDSNRPYANAIWTSSCRPRDSTCGLTNLLWPRKTGSVNRRPPAATAFARANGIDRVVLDGSASHVGALSAPVRRSLTSRQALAGSRARRRDVRAAGCLLVQAGAHLAHG